jgi:hypothetical protein
MRPNDAGRCENWRNFKDNLSLARIGAGDWKLGIGGWRLVAVHGRFDPKINGDGAEPVRTSLVTVKPTADDVLHDEPHHRNQTDGSQENLER